MTTEEHMAEATEIAIHFCGDCLHDAKRVIAAALAAAEQRGRDEERERCAKVVSKHFEGDGWGSSYKNIGDAIAAAIRQPSTGDER